MILVFKNDTATISRLAAFHDKLREAHRKYRERQELARKRLDSK